MRTIHERLFFRPLLEAFATVETSPRPPLTTLDAPEETSRPVMSAAAVARRLDAFGFSDATRTRAAVQDLAGGLTRSSRLMAQLLPLLLDWLSLSPDPDLGPPGAARSRRARRTSARCWSPPSGNPPRRRAACACLLGSSRTLVEAIERNPELIPMISDDVALTPTPRDVLVSEAGERLQRNEDESWRRAQLVRMRQDQYVRIAARDLLDVDDVVATGRALTAMSEALLEVSLEVVNPGMPFSIIGLGRLGGAEMSYASDLDLLLVFDDADDLEGELVAESLLHLVHGPSPSQRVAAIDLGLRPEGGQGRLARDLQGYSGYFDRWAETWERQALARARLVAGDRALGERFMALVGRVRVGPAPRRRRGGRHQADEGPHRTRADPVARGSAVPPEVGTRVPVGHRVDRAVAPAPPRRPRGEHAQRPRGPRRSRPALPDDLGALRDAYRFCEQTRNRWHLVGALPGGASPGDALPTQADQLSHLARSLGTTPSALRDDYRRLTRRARRVVDRTFYGIIDG